MAGGDDEWERIGGRETSSDRPVILWWGFGHGSVKETVTLRDEVDCCF